MDKMLQPKDTDWLNGYKNKTHIYAVYKTHFRPQDTYRLKVRGWKNIFHANGKQKKAEVAILITDKIDLKIKKVTRDKEGHYIMIKGSIQEEDIRQWHPTPVLLFGKSHGRGSLVGCCLWGRTESDTTEVT